MYLCCEGDEGALDAGEGAHTQSAQCAALAALGAPRVRHGGQQADRHGADGARHARVSDGGRAVGGGDLSGVEAATAHQEHGRAQGVRTRRARAPRRLEALLERAQDAEGARVVPAHRQARARSGRRVGLLLQVRGGLRH